jgi:hypothetical protein
MPCLAMKVLSENANYPTSLAYSRAKRNDVVVAGHPCFLYLPVPRLMLCCIAFSAGLSSHFSHDGACRRDCDCLMLNEAWRSEICGLVRCLLVCSPACDGTWRSRYLAAVSALPLKSKPTVDPLIALIVLLTGSKSKREDLVGRA